MGMIFIAWTKRWAESLQSNTAKVSQMVLAFALIFHNLPEGMAAGAALAGFDLHKAVPILASISAQNIVEGLLLTLCLRGLGASTFWAVLGGFGSGLIEFSGSMLAGWALEATSSSLPFLLSLAGGAMLWSVLVEYEEGIQARRHFRLADFSVGLAVVPLLNVLTGF